MTSASNKSRSREIIGTVISLLLAVFFSYIAFRGINMAEFTGSLKNISIVSLLLFSFTTISAHWLRAIRWKILLRGVKPGISTHHSFAALMIGYGVNNVVPRLGEVSRALLLGQYEGISRMSVLGSIMIERIIDTLCFGISILIAGLIFSGSLYDQFPWLRTTFLVGIGLFLALLPSLFVLIRHQDRVEGLVNRLIGRLSPKAASFTSKLLFKLISGFSSLKDPAVLMWTGVLSIAIMLNYALSSYFAFFLISMGGPSAPDFGMAWVVMAISAIGVMIPTPGGIGSYHSITRTTLVSLYGFSANSAVVYAFLSHGIGYLLMVIFALGYFVSFRKKYGKLEETSAILEENNNNG